MSLFTKATSKAHKPMRKGVFFVPFTLLLVTLIFGAVDSEGFSNVLDNLLNFCFQHFGWLINFSSFLWVVLLIGLMFSKWGKVKLGGKDAKPTMSTFHWCAITLTSGMAIGIAFWGVAEPLLHYSNPPAALGIEPSSAESAVWGLKTAMHHWGVTPYAIYLLFGLAIAYAVYNKNQPMAVSSCLYPVLGEKGLKRYGGIVDALTLFAIAGGVAHSLGLGILQLSNGIAYISGIKSLATNPIVWISVAVAIIVAYTLTSYSGIERGITWMADRNVDLYVVILVFLVIVGPTYFITNAGVEALGMYISDFVSYSTWMGITDVGGNLVSDSWVASWPIFYWGIFLAYGPVVGLFLARIGYGRTIKQFILVNLFMPTIVSIIWFSIFGGSAIFLDYVQNVPLAEAVQADYSVAVYAFLEQFPLSKISMIVMMLVAAVSFITLANSMSTAVATLSTSGHTIDDPEPPAKYKIFWAIIMGGCAIVGVFAGGVQPLKIMGTLAGIPIMFLAFFCALSLILFAIDSKTDILSKIKEIFAEKKEKKKNKSTV
ncbi:putative glycine betaine transporter [Eubacterium callanderi]|uniref:BCCT family transporter n=1 Tax=Eubacterium callanderi TaxID=53442 RepID=UPI0029FF3A19|nr:BCCT family transporter [Eubacterium callanderi]WPK69180.1 putative glycine betaine transporter [Eubacterium callanderi]WPK73478.1 putative glycine betaine transporter [Eubacterium callanderi]